MKIDRALALIAVSLLAACAGPGPRIAPPEGAEIRALPGGETLSFRDLTARMMDADLVILGELHDDPRHQAMQAALIAATNAPAAAFEMIPASAEAALAQLRAKADPSDADRAAAAWDRYEPWHPPIRTLSADAPAIGAGVERTALRGAIGGTAAAMFDGDAAAFGLSAPLPPATQAAMEDEQMRAHCNAMPAEMAPGMVEAQRLRDAAFASALLRAADARARPGPAVLVTGDGHARRDRGSPAYLAAAAPSRSLLVVGQINRPADGDWRAALAQWQGADGAPAFDVVVITDAPQGRGDPCEAFRKQK
jgi:uncharacterized iron-regulated protein